MVPKSIARACRNEREVTVFKDPDGDQKYAVQVFEIDAVLAFRRGLTAKKTFKMVMEWLTD
jgi:hypothetical protein